MPTKEDVIQVLKNVMDPEPGVDIVSLGMVKDVNTGSGTVRVILELTTPVARFVAN